MTKRELTDDEIEELLYGDSFEGHTYEEVSEERVGDSRWMDFFQTTLRRDDGTFWQLSYSRGKTEYQDNGLEDAEFYQVWPREVTTVTYVSTPPDGKEVAVASSAD